MQRVAAAAAVLALGVLFAAGHSTQHLLDLAIAIALCPSILQLLQLLWVLLLVVLLLVVGVGFALRLRAPLLRHFAHFLQTFKAAHHQTVHRLTTAVFARILFHL